MRIGIGGRLGTLVLGGALLLLAVPLLSAGTEAAVQTLHLEQAQQLALGNAYELTQTYNKILLKQMKYTESVNAVRAKVKNLTSFRYSPLLSFKFPEKLDMTQEYELNIKPLTLQVEITTLQHQLEDQRLEVWAKAGKAFTAAYVLQEKADYTAQMLEQAEEELERNRARLLAGAATASDVERMERSVEALTGDLALVMRNYETAKADLSDRIGLDVSTGYRFANPFRELQVPRDALEAITAYTLAEDMTCYEARMALSTAQLNLDAYESLMRGQYGSKLDAVQPFLNTARQGQSVDYSAFKLQYDAMLKNFDKPWDGRMRILFFTFTKEWFKGEISGTRYIEDEMYALYTACMEYESARKDRDNTEKALRKEVESSFELLVTARNAAEEMKVTLARTGEELDRLLLLNQIGRAEYSEVGDKREDYQSLQIETIDALATYNELLLDFDRLTCGAVTHLMSTGGLETATGGSGQSLLIAGAGDAPTYSLYSDIANMVFVFSVDIPEGFEPEITHYELWYEGTQIGERTAVDRQLRHLTLDYGESYTLTVRLFDGQDYLDECEIDTTVPHDLLDLEGQAPPPEPTGRTVGSYTVSTSTLGGLGRSTLSLSVEPGEGARYYTLSFQGGELLTDQLVPVEESFHYLTLLIASMDEVEVTLYGRTREPVAVARFDTAAGTLVTIPDTGP